MYADGNNGLSPRYTNQRDSYERDWYATRHRLELRHVLGGLQAGVVGALVMFLWVMIGSLWNGRSIWVVPNLFASTFFGSNAYRNEFLRTSLAGVALIVAVYGLLGALWGGVWRDHRQKWLWLYGAFAGIAVYFAVYDLIWQHINPLVVLYAPNRQLQWGHIVWGIVLSRSPLYAGRIFDRNTHPGMVEPHASTPVHQSDVLEMSAEVSPAVSNGEVSTREASGT